MTTVFPDTTFNVGDTLRKVAWPTTGFKLPREVFSFYLPEGRTLSTAIRFSDTQRRQTSNTHPDWLVVAGRLSDAIRDARGNGAQVTAAAVRVAEQVSRMLQYGSARPPAIVDNGIGGIAFYWRARKREIQIEIDPDGSYFVRIKNSLGETIFSEERFGSVPVRVINDALREWAENIAPVCDQLAPRG